MSAFRYRVVVLDSDEISGEVLDEGLIPGGNANQHIAQSMDAWLAQAADRRERPTLEITVEPING